MRKLFALLLALVLVLSLAACGGGNSDKPPDGGNDSPGTSQQEQDESAEDDPAPEGVDAEYEIFVNGEEEWRPFPGKSGVTFSVSDTYVIACRETSSTISFTGKQVGRSTITATLDGVEKIATVKVKRMVEKEERYYITYKEPISHYSYEMDGGPDNGGSKVTFDGETHWEYSYEDGILFGRWMTMDGAYSFTENGEQIAGTEYKDSDGIFDLNMYYWPCSEFAQQMAGAFYDDDGNLKSVGTNTGLYEFYAEKPEKLPDQADATDLYVKSEQINGVDCHVFKINNVNYGHEDLYWVDPETGWTLQYARQDQDTGEIDIRWTVTSFEISTPQ